MGFKIDKTALDKLKKDLTNLPQKVDGILKNQLKVVLIIYLIAQRDLHQLTLGI